VRQVVVDVAAVADTVAVGLAGVLNKRGKL
jgi:hypothetical protein